jgi:thymidine phosphorylase
VGRGIGPALEAKDVLSVLRNENNAPDDLRERAVILAGRLLEMGGKAAEGSGTLEALRVLKSGDGYKKFTAICEAQGFFREPEVAPHKHRIRSAASGVVSEIDNRRLAKVAKLAGAPGAMTAGILLLTPLCTHVEENDTLFEIHAESQGELEYALSYLDTQKQIIKIKAT